MRSGKLLLFVLAGLVSVGCSTVDQRHYYRQAIAGFKGIPSASNKCWLAADLVGGSSGSPVIAEEEFTKYLVEKNLCKVVEKHPDSTVGYTWPEADRCPCAAGQTVCSGAQCTAAAGGSSGFGGFGGGSSDGNDNNRSGDKILERFKKSTVPDKLITYRIDELTKKKAIIHFRVSDVKRSGGTIEASEVITVYPRAEPETARE
jgi:hypothetical protein